jgi:hypothetical protein
MRTLRGRAEPDVYFRMVHLAQVGHHGGPAATHREQTLEIALGAPSETGEGHCANQNKNFRFAHIGRTIAV